MEAVRQYLMSVIAAAVICAIVRALTQNKGASSEIIKLICGVFIAITLISPWNKISISGIVNYIEDFSLDAENITSAASESAREEQNKIIKAQTEAYIQDKALSMGVQLQADITVSNLSPGLPQRVEITANASPYQRQQITGWIETDLGIPEDQQIWN